jgi:hypothetical protein
MLTLGGKFGIAIDAGIGGFSFSDSIGFGIALKGDDKLAVAIPSDPLVCRLT